MPPNSPSHSVRVVAPEQIGERDVRSWVALEARALEPNAYLSPHYVLPQLRHLETGRAPQVFLVERQLLHARELVGVAVLRDVAPNLAFPVRRLVGYHTHFMTLGGLLLDRECAHEALAALLHHVQGLHGQYGALELPFIWSDGPLPQLVRTLVADSGFEPQLTHAVPRAVMVPARAAQTLRSPALAHRLRDLGRRQRRLQERGQVAWRLLGADGVPDGAVESLLRLEHLGWKGSGGSSLRSRPAQEAFFREVVARFAAERRVQFSEITLDGAAIASACNFLSGRMAFAFKIGWDPQLRCCSPGWLNEVEYLRNAATHLAGIELVDSGAAEDSYINDLWLDRRTIATLTVPLSFTGRLAMGGLTSVRMLKRRVTGAVTWMFASMLRRRRVLAPAR